MLRAFVFFVLLFFWEFAVFHIQQAFCLTKDDECKQISFLYDYFCDVHPDLVQLSSRKIVTAEAAKMKSSQKIPHLD